MLFNVITYTYNFHFRHAHQLTLEEVSQETKYSFGGGGGDAEKARVHWESFPTGDKQVLRLGLITLVVERLA